MTVPRRVAPLLLLGLTAQAPAPGGFDAFLLGVRREAQAAGISAGTLNRALAGIGPNPRVLELDRRQAEFTQSWEAYRDGRLSQSRIDNGRRAYAANRGLLSQVQGRTRVAAGTIMGIWGLETGYGTFTGSFNVIEALATLAWDGRRSAYFRAELLAALRILEAGHIAPERMRGSHAGAMGQPQFMPTSFERLAMDFDGDGRRDIWDNRADALGSIGNYLARSGWREGEGWGFEIALPPGFDAGYAEPSRPRPAAEWPSLDQWARLGIRRMGGGALGQGQGAVIIPANQESGMQAFMALPNFHAIRRYNPSTFYALTVGMLGDRVVA